MERKVDSVSHCQGSGAGESEKAEKQADLLWDVQQGGVFELRLGVLIDWDLNVLVRGRLTFGVGLREVPGKPQPTFRPLFMSCSEHRHERHPCGWPPWS